VRQFLFAVIMLVAAMLALSASSGAAADRGVRLMPASGNVLAVANEQPVRVAWLGPRKLAVTGFVEPAYRRSARVGSITIEFRPAGTESNSARPHEP
jgi:hypothetical protein